MKSNEIRQAFLDFFASKQHQIVASSPMVVKNDPTLMFTNAGMNQFKDIFLGNSPVKFPRIADTQKCLRVSGKHNDLEEVGHDTYHHTMFEMLGNWSFGDYFKKEAIAWAWEFLADKMEIDKSRMYVTIFEGSKEDKLERDNDAANFWKQYIDEDRIIEGSKKDNFWEMGDTGPCGPCSEIHVDIRSDVERKKIDGKSLVNAGHPHVIEIWNLVFIQFNRKADESLESLPNKHVDTGMGFERLSMVVQGKQSNYDTDVFIPIIDAIANLSKIKYGDKKESDIAMRVVADHLRTIAFSIADGQLPSNNKAGYVIRRILRRAVRYGYTFMHFNSPFISKLVPVLVSNMGAAFPELKAQQQLIEKVIFEEETAFLKTLEHGINMLESIIEKAKIIKSNIVAGSVAFELYDTFGFPFDLTQLLARENNFTVDEVGFNTCMEQQKNRSRNAATVDTDDWMIVNEIEEEKFIGYDSLIAEVIIAKYRKVKSKNEEFFQVVFDQTPFYAESGGQLGDVGYIEANGEKIIIIDTKKENNLGIHILKNLPKNLTVKFNAVVDFERRTAIANNHSATHLLHEALRSILGTHVEQKGSLVSSDHLRFDFAHFQKVSDEEIRKAEQFVNQKIRENLLLEEKRSVPVKEAKTCGAMALFGEKYGDFVRTIKFGSSIELCGGTHVHATGQIGYFKIVSESAIAAGIRRIEAITALKAEEFIYEQIDTIDAIKVALKNSKDVLKSIDLLLRETVQLKQQIETFEKEKVLKIKDVLISKMQVKNGIAVIAEKIEISNVSMVKDIAFLIKEQVENLYLVIGLESEGKASITVMISENIAKEKNLNAGNIVREAAKEINGGGGGQPFYATAGGKTPEGLQKAIEKALSFIHS